MGSVKQAWIQKYGEEDGLYRWNEHKKKFSRTKQQLIDEHGIDYYNELREKKITYSLEACIKKYGEIEGPIKWEERKAKKLKKQKENCINGLCNFGHGRTLDGMQEKYGIDIGYEKWIRRNKRQSYMTSKQRYIDEFGEELGTKICYDIKNNSTLDKFISRYGEDIGNEKYKENCRNCSITLPKMIEKYGYDLGIKKYNDWYLKVTTAILNQSAASKSSQKLFWDIYNTLSDDYQKKCKFHELNEEQKYFFWTDKKCQCYKIDFKCGKYILEFNGVYWHEIRNNQSEYDLTRKNRLENLGYHVDVIRDLDYHKDPNNVLNKIIQTIYETA